MMETEKTNMVEAHDKFQIGDVVRENRQGCQPEMVISINHPMVTTDRGFYHWTKLVLVERQ